MAESARGLRAPLPPGAEAQLYGARGCLFRLLGAHQSNSPLLYEGFPFGRPIPLAAPERFFALFSVMLGEFFSARRTRESVLSSLCSALVEMLSSEVELKGTLFYSFLSLREDIFRSPECEWTAEGAAARLNLSKGYFHTLYKQYFGTTFYRMSSSRACRRRRICSLPLRRASPASQSAAAISTRSTSYANSHSLRARRRTATV